MLGELGLPYDHKDYLPRSAETKTPELVRCPVRVRRLRGLALI
jgi:hypothetical protein